MPDYEVYTTGGGFYLYDIFNFLAMFSSGSMFYDMLTIGIVIGVFYIAIKVLMSGSLEGFLPYLITVAVVGGLGVGPKARVIIMDSTHPLEIYGAVDNVPLSVAFVASITSKTSYEITRRMETLLSTPDNLVYQEHGMLFGASLMAQAARWRAVTPSIQANLVNFMENCMVDGTNIGLVNLDELTREGDLAAYIGANAPGALAYYDEVAEATVTCTGGWAALEASLNDEVIRILQVRANARSPRNGNGAGIVETGALTGTLEDFQNMMGMASYDATTYLKQSMLVLALDDAAGRLIANSGNSAAMELYQTARAENQTRSSYQVIGANATKWVPLIKIAFETLYYGAFPLALLMMMTPMAMTVARGYFGGFVWLAAWEPLSAILHTTLLKSSTGWYREHTTTLSGASATDVLNWANHFGIQSVEQDVGLVAGYLMMSVPFLSFAIMFGATKMAGLATSMLNVSQGAAIDTGREAATGSMSLGNTSMNNMNANKWNTSSMMDAGRSTRVLADGGLTTANADGSRTYSSGSSQSNVGMSAMIGQTVREEVSDRASEATRAVETQTQDFANSVSTTASQLSDFGMSMSNNQTAGWENSTAFTQEDRSNISEAWSEVERFSATHGLSTDLGMKAMLAGEAGLGVNAIAKLSASLQANGSLNASSVENFQNAAQAAHNQEYSESLGTLQSYAERAQVGANATEGVTANNSVRSNFDQVQSSAERLSAAYEQAQSLEHANAYLQSQDMSYNARLTDAVIAELGEQGYNEDQISALVNPKTTAGVMRQQEVVDQILPGILNELGLSQRNYSEPMVPITETPILEHTPVDPNSNTVVAPEGSNLPNLQGNTNERIVANAWSDDNYDAAFGAHGAKEGIETTIAEGQELAQGSPVDAMVDRGREVAEDIGSGLGLLGNNGTANSEPETPAIGSTSPISTAFQGTPAGFAASLLQNGLTAASGINQAMRADDTPPASTPPLPNVPEQPTPEQYVARANAGLQDNSLAEDNALSIYERDVVTRTILGEAANQGDLGQAAVAHVIQNRVDDPRWGDDPAEVSLAMKQFSAWNSGAGGNHLVDQYQPGDPAYDRAAAIADMVFNGQTQDPTDGATHYYSPAGMAALVNNGDQSNSLPRWLQEENARRGGETVTIGGHIFTGKAQD